MDKKDIRCDNTETEKHQFHQYKSPISKNNIDINKIVLFNKIFNSKMYFIYLIGYKDSSCTFLSLMSAY